MGENYPLPSDTTFDAQKRRRVCFRDVDPGIDVHECMKIYLVSREEEVGCQDSFSISPVSLNGYFNEGDDDGKIYGYQGLEITVWISILSFSAYAEVSYQIKDDGGKGITDLNSALRKIFGDTILDDRDSFIQTFTSEKDFISCITCNGEKVFPRLSNGHVDYKEEASKTSSDLKVVRLKFDGPAAAILYNRLVPLVLLLVDGSNPIEVTDPRWDLYALVRSEKEDAGERLIGFTAIYRFYRYPEQIRWRLGQILVLPPFQGMGYGRKILEEVHNVAIGEDVYDLTVEEPLDYFEQVRSCYDVERLTKFAPIQEAVGRAVCEARCTKKNVNPPASVVDEVRRALKITGKHFSQCWEVLLYHRMHSPEDYSDEFVAMLSDRYKGALLGRESAMKQILMVPNQFNQDMSFVLVKAYRNTAAPPSGYPSNLDHQLSNLVRGRIVEIRDILHKLQLD